jgi:hypothetical protein
MSSPSLFRRFGLIASARFVASLLLLTTLGTASASASPTVDEPAGSSRFFVLEAREPGLLLVRLEPEALALPTPVLHVLAAPRASQIVAQGDGTLVLEIVAPGLVTLEVSTLDPNATLPAFELRAQHLPTSVFDPGSLGFEVDPWDDGVDGPKPPRPPAPQPPTP